MQGYLVSVLGATSKSGPRLNHRKHGRRTERDNSSVGATRGTPKGVHTVDLLVATFFFLSESRKTQKGRKKRKIRRRLLSKNKSFIEAAVLWNTKRVGNRSSLLQKRRIPSLFSSPSSSSVISVILTKRRGRESEFPPTEEVLVYT